MIKSNSIYFLLIAFMMGIAPMCIYNAYTQTAERLQFEVESDPLAFVFNGYSLHAAITYSGFRTSLGVFAIETPDFLLQNEAYSVYTSGYDVKTDYLFGESRGFFAGIQLTYTADILELKDGEGDTDRLRNLNIGIRAGYRFMFGKKENNYKGFYISPWVALLYNPSTKTVSQGAEEYKQASWVPFPTIHLGWRF
ncbi:hypothetical protein JHJ32_04610 [Parapedobacter sp. ISTM3]|uniref:hypothetical protein n=1 Tax=Parapedobacter sp. ISTM3 TaxID=2800130 RepID=UPI001903B61C|nr:hypothetical protein [Parapedobacter sp. ISTM3]MBK1439261.1 hypothetical protein [Parapedobacter sp. ISTM3]